MAYYPHNIHFIVTSAQMAGDMKTAVAEAQRLRTVLDPETSARIGWIQAIDAAPFLAMAQFASPEAILQMPTPDCLTRGRCATMRGPSHLRSVGTVRGSMRRSRP